MNAARERLLYTLAAAWLILGMLCYTYVFTRDFYKANAPQIHRILQK